jgi:8-oxo-dGTP pyrophosphatase MutT (NUDIX family)
MTYTVTSHLDYFKVPLADFAAARPEFDGFAVGGYIFSHADPTPRVLLLQRALTDSMPGRWECPGGASELEVDETLLDSVAREILEESGLHVSRIVDIVAVDCWEHHRRNGATIRLSRYSFLVEVHESRQESAGNWQHVPTLQIPVKLDPLEHQQFKWATEEEAQSSVQSVNGRYNLLFPHIGRQGRNILRAFEMIKERQSKVTAGDLVQ